MARTSSGWSTGSTRGWATLLRPRQLRGQQRAREASELALLEAYFAEPATTRRIATLRLMKFMSDFREAMWGVVQTALSELDFDFHGYAAKHFERMLETAGHRDFETWLSEAREPKS